MHNDRRDILNLLLFLLVSLLLHLLVLLLGREFDWQPAQSEKPPVYIEMQAAPERDRELDLPKTPDQSRTTAAKRLGPSDHVAPQETAPIGDAPEDRLPAVSVPVAAETPPQPQPQLKPSPAPDAIEHPVPDLTSLLTLPQATQVRIGEEFRRKYRPDVTAGDAVWLDTEKDVLISFFQRLRKGIYDNWSYPAASIENGEEGQYLIEMIFDRNGKVLDVYLVNGQVPNHPLLVREAIAAVFKGAPYGKLSSNYDKETLTVKAWFSYSLERRGRPDIFGQR